jgi:type IV pilus assembly protein PilM
MAKTSAVWGIDIGQCALKALRCRPHERDDHRLVVEAFDYIEYSKILTQPEADREALIREALEQFVSRNEVQGDRVAIAVPGQSGLARFIKLPPVESKKIPDIVKYEARQQIPFALEDVVWDYQPLVGSEDEGYALETEVGLFAMKRDQVARALRPLEEAGIPVDIIQLAPLAIYNFVCFDRLKLEGAYDPANPPPSIVVISLGTDTTDLVITNGYRVWQRNIPIGGNHFTKALTKELKLTFAKAEHLKRNAMKAENPKVVFQAMRPVFSDLVAEIQRSIGFFTSNNKSAKLEKIVALGNPLKLPGLQRFLSQNLDQEVQVIDQFNCLVGGTSTASPQFKENQLTFGVAYGLCVQALGHSQISTSLLPEEIVTRRLVRAKKPWAVAAVAALLVAMTLNFARQYAAWASSNVNDTEMKQALSASESWVSQARQLKDTNTQIVSKFDENQQIVKNLQNQVDGRLLWLELWKAILAALPKDERAPDARQETAEDVSKRPELHVTRLDEEYVPDLALWYENVKRFRRVPGGPVERNAAVDGLTPAEEPAAGAGEIGAPPVNDLAAAADPGAAVSGATIDPLAGDVGATPGAGEDPGPTGPGWVIEIEGQHWHNSLTLHDPNFPDGEGAQFIRNTFFKQLETGTVELPNSQGKNVLVKIKDLGIGYPVIVRGSRIEDKKYYPRIVEDATALAAAAFGGGDSRMVPMPSMGSRSGLGAAAAEPEVIQPWSLRQYDFVIQICWIPKLRSEREKAPVSPGVVAAPSPSSAAGL